MGRTRTYRTPPRGTMTGMHATPDDLAYLTDDVPVNADRLLAHASRLITYATRHAHYATDEDGHPTDGLIADALRDATCAQVVSWIEGGLATSILSGGTTAEAQVASSTDNGSSISLDHSAANEARARAFAGGLAPEAEMILMVAGLLGGLPGVIL